MQETLRNASSTAAARATSSSAPVPSQMFEDAVRPFPGARVLVVEEMTSNDRDRDRLPVGTRGVVKLIDESGDAQVDFFGIPKLKWIFKRNFGKLQVFSATAAGAYAPVEAPKAAETAPAPTTVERQPRDSHSEGQARRAGPPFAEDWSGQGRAGRLSLDSDKSRFLLPTRSSAPAEIRSTSADRRQPLLPTADSVPSCGTPLVPSCGTPLAPSGPSYPSSPPRREVAPRQRGRAAHGESAQQCGSAAESRPAALEVTRIVSMPSPQRSSLAEASSRSGGRNGSGSPTRERVITSAANAISMTPPAGTGLQRMRSAESLLPPGQPPNEAVAEAKDEYARTLATMIDGITSAIAVSSGGSDPGASSGSGAPLPGVVRLRRCLASLEQQVRMHPKAVEQLDKGTVASLLDLVGVVSNLAAVPRETQERVMDLVRRSCGRKVEATWSPTKQVPTTTGTIVYPEGPPPNRQVASTSSATATLRAGGRALSHTPASCTPAAVKAARSKSPLPRTTAQSVRQVSETSAGTGTAAERPATSISPSKAVAAEQQPRERTVLRARSSDNAPADRVRAASCQAPTAGRTVLTVANGQNATLTPLFVATDGNPQKITWKADGTVVKESLATCVAAPVYSGLNANVASGARTWVTIPVAQGVQNADGKMVTTGSFDQKYDVDSWLDAASEFEMNTDFDVAVALRSKREPDLAAIQDIMKEESNGKRTIQALADKLMLHRLIANLGIPQMPNLLAAERAVTAQDMATLIHHHLNGPQKREVILKPTHLSNGSGVVTISTPQAHERQATVDYLVSHVTKFLAERAAPRESAALRSLRPGVVVQPKYKSVVEFKMPLELRVMVLWGKVRMSFWWWGRDVPESTRNAWFARKAATPGKALDINTDTWECIHEHSPNNPGFFSSLKLFKRHLRETAIAAEALATAVGAPFLRADFFVGSAEWGVRLNEVAYGCGAEYRNMVPDGSSNRVVDDSLAIGYILLEGYRRCRRRAPPEHFLSRLGATGFSYADLTVREIPASLRPSLPPGAAREGAGTDCEEFAVSEDQCKTPSIGGGLGAAVVPAGQVLRPLAKASQAPMMSSVIRSSVSAAVASASAGAAQARAKTNIQVVHQSYAPPMKAASPRLHTRTLESVQSDVLRPQRLVSGSSCAVAASGPLVAESSRARYRRSTSALPTPRSASRALQTPAGVSSVPLRCY
eukprot:TRINITY_DN110792_c0_g1_i1.p1 TRINITY_DN110792_c0_g1~~TRINITY_DN110792_c0_g1_i1.p1  ORF type:complete len:1199 (+),score=198.51 TRINITY_DN110792_c0_g1_i1:150-3746(+)